MKLHLYCTFALVALAVVASYAELSPQGYWESVLPNTPMPKAVRELLRPDLEDEKSTYVGVGKGGVHVHAGTGKPGGTTVNVGKGGVGVHTGKPGKRTDVGVGKGGVSVHTGNHGKPGGTSVHVGKGGVGVHTGKPGKGTHVGVGKGGVTVRSRGKGGKPVYVGVKPGPNPFEYSYAATETQLHDDPNVALFFLEKDLHSGQTMDLQFTERPNGATFLPRQVANSVPFSSDKLPEIYSEFSVKPKSLESEIIKDTIKQCESSGIKGEEKYCATSLESMVDFSTSKLGKSVHAYSTEVEGETKLQKYTIQQGVKKVPGHKFVACHKQNYPYAVFSCHTSQSTEVYMVPLKGADGTRVEAVAVCHTNTSAWNPKHVAFQVLKVDPGTVPICHFLPQDHIVWAPNQTSAQV